MERSRDSSFFLRIPISAVFANFIGNGRDKGALPKDVTPSDALDTFFRVAKRPAGPNIGKDWQPSGGILSIVTECGRQKRHPQAF